MIVSMGNNDILFVFSPADVVTVDQIIAGHRQLIRRAHARGLKIYGATLTPFGGFVFSSAEKEAKRQAVNHWIRTSGEYDAVIDFDAVVRDPSNPTRLRSDLRQWRPSASERLRLRSNGQRHRPRAVQERESRIDRQDSDAEFGLPRRSSVEEGRSAYALGAFLSERFGEISLRLPSHPRAMAGQPGTRAKAGDLGGRCRLRPLRAELHDCERED